MCKLIYIYYISQTNIIYYIISTFFFCLRMFGQSSGVEIIQDGSNKTEKEILQTLEDSTVEDNVNNTDDDDDNYNELDEDVGFSRVSISDILDNRELMGECTSNWDDYIVYNMPKHHRYASHTLNLIATSVRCI